MAADSVRVDSLMLPDPKADERFTADRLDTIVALNVVEHIEDDIGALAAMRTCWRRAVGSSFWCRRCRRSMARWIVSWAISDVMVRQPSDAFHQAGFRVDRMFWWNRVGVLGWWFNGRVRKVTRIPIDQLKRFDSLVPMLKFERFLPLPFGQSLIAVGSPV